MLHVKTRRVHFRLIKQTSGRRSYGRLNNSLDQVLHVIGILAHNARGDRAGNQITIYIRVSNQGVSHPHRDDGFQFHLLYNIPNVSQSRMSPSSIAELFLRQRYTPRSISLFMRILQKILSSYSASFEVTRTLGVSVKNVSKEGLL